MIEQAFNRLTDHAESEKRRGRMVAPLFFLAYGVTLLFRRKPL